MVIRGLTCEVSKVCKVALFFPLPLSKESSFWGIDILIKMV